MLEQSTVYRNLETRHSVWGLEIPDWILLGLLLLVMFFFIESLFLKLGIWLPLVFGLRLFKKGKREHYTLHFFRYHLRPKAYSPLDRDPRARRYDPR